jgi:hypothetical protein
MRSEDRCLAEAKVALYRIDGNAIARMYKIIGTDQKEYGPVSADELRQWIYQGRANAQSWAVAYPITSEWRALGSFSEFTAALAAATPNYFPPAAPYRRPRGRTNNGMAITGFVLSILSVPCCGLGAFSILGLIFSIVGLLQLRNRSNQTGKGLAIAGIVISLLTLLLMIIGWSLVIAGIAHSNPQTFSDPT